MLLFVFFFSVCVQLKLSEGVTELQLDGLIPDTEYMVTVYTVHGDEAGEPVTSQQTTSEHHTHTHTREHTRKHAPSPLIT